MGGDVPAYVVAAEIIVDGLMLIGCRVHSLFPFERFRSELVERETVQSSTCCKANLPFCLHHQTRQAEVHSDLFGLLLGYHACAVPSAHMMAPFGAPKNRLLRNERVEGAHG